MKLSRGNIVKNWQTFRIYFVICGICAAFLFLRGAIVDAEHLPIKNYTVADNLAHSRIMKIFQDAKGFLWVATGEGLSRFDGYEFTNYGRSEGLGNDFVNDVIADRDGHLWAATNGGGVSRLLDKPIESAKLPANQRFITFSVADGGEKNSANWVNRIVFDAENRLWCVTDAGLFRAKNLEVADNDFELVISGTQPTVQNAAFSDSGGRLWFGVNQRVVSVADGQTTIYEFSSDVVQFVEIERGRVLAATVEGVYEFVEAEKTWRELEFKISANEQIQTMATAADGGLWIGTNRTLIYWRDGRQKFYNNRNGLIGSNIFALTADRENNLWVGTLLGLSKLTATNFAGYTSADGLPTSDVYRVASDNKGNIYAQVGCSPYKLVKISEQTTEIIQTSEYSTLDCRVNKLFQDRFGRFWFFTKSGLEISDAPKLDLAKGRVLNFPDGKPITNYRALYDDANGKIWLVSGGDLYAANVKSDMFPRFELVARNVPTDFILRDSSGILWLADRDNLRRLREGKIEPITKIDNLNVIHPRCLFEDSRGRVWVGTRSDGAVYTDAPQAENVSFKNFTTADGLTSDTVWTIAEDNQKAIYFGTGRGVDRLDAAGKMRHLTADEGVIGSVINHLFKDQKGNIWAAANEGLSRINPSGLRENLQPPPIFITRVLVAGEQLPLDETGVSDFADGDLAANQNNVAIRFVGLSFGGEHALHYEYRLEGVDAEWTRAGEQREVNYANLGAGKYRFAVRAVNAAGVASETPATFEFQILRPIWQRTWFLVLTIVFLALASVAFYRYRLNKLLEIERTRTRIASDLHDDIGTNLSKISLLSEIVNMQLASQNIESNRLLNSIAEISRESVGSMSDIVWAINPKRDSVSELVRRMRLHVEEIFLDKDVRVIFNAPDDASNKLSMNARREIFLIFKESVNNAVRHSDCAKIEIDFRLEGGIIYLRVADDGKGFDISNETDGNGLENMQNRAEKNGGKFEIESEKSGGTILKISFPQN